MKEIEAKIIEVDAKAVEAKLLALGALHEFTAEFRAEYYDSADMRLKAKGEVLRLRKEGPESVMTFKHLLPNEDTTIKIREELEVKVSDFELARKILLGLGYQNTLNMNKTRSQYRLGQAHVVIDDYVDDFAHIPVFLEIEAPSVAELQAVARQLGYDPADLKSWSAAELIAHYARP